MVPLRTCNLDPTQVAYFGLVPNIHRCRVIQIELANPSIYARLSQLSSADTRRAADAVTEFTRAHMGWPPRSRR